jgi:DNA-binding beta-propeller fold protein YncE
MNRNQQRNSRRHAASAIALAAAAACAGGCASPGVIFEPLESPPQWPPPPAPARIRYVGSIERDTDLKPGKSIGAAIGELFFGRPPARSMLTPYAVCTDDRNRLFVADSNAQVVHVFDLDDRVYEQWQPGPGQPPFAQPVGVAIDPRNRLLVSDSVAGLVFVFDQTGAPAGTLGDGVLQRPCGLAVDAAGSRLFVADTGTHEVLVFSLEGDLLTRVGGRGSAPGRFNYPTNVAVDSVGRLYVSDTLNFRVQVFDPSLTPVRQIGAQGDRPGYFSQPKGLDLDGDDHLYVVDARFEAVQIFDAAGQLLLSFGQEGNGPGQFWLPAGLHVDSNDRIWIADSYNRRVQVFDYRPEVEP